MECETFDGRLCFTFFVFAHQNLISIDITVTCLRVSLLTLNVMETPFDYHCFHFQIEIHFFEFFLPVNNYSYYS